MRKVAILAIGFWVIVSFLFPVKGSAQTSSYGLNTHPGSVYKEFFSDSGGWRVTDRNTNHTSQYPNSTYTITVEDFTNAVKAEAVVIRWGGHPGTSRRRIAFGYGNNEYNQVPENRWLNLPELETTPDGHRPECYMHFDNPAVEVPLSHLKTGVNKFVLDAGPQVCHSFNWGQWGFYGMVLRVYYDENAKDHPTGQITAPTSGNLSENPQITVNPQSPTGIEKVDVIGYYLGPDYDGDGYYQEWQEFWYRDRNASATPAHLEGHIGTSTGAPWQVTWNTSEIPDQTGIQIIARIKDKNGIWHVTDPVDNLSLVRDGESVSILRPQNVPEKFWVRVNQKKSSEFTLPTEIPLSSIKNAQMHWRTWEQKSGSISINNQSAGLTGGGSHTFFQTFKDVKDYIQNGKNTISIENHTDHHGSEVMWPGPYVVIKKTGDADISISPVELGLDIDADGDIDFLDFNLLLVGFGSSYDIYDYNGLVKEL